MKAAPDRDTHRVDAYLLEEVATGILKGVAVSVGEQILCVVLRDVRSFSTPVARLRHKRRARHSKSEITVLTEMVLIESKLVKHTMKSIGLGLGIGLGCWLGAEFMLGFRFVPPY